MRRSLPLCILCAGFALPPVAAAGATPSLSLLSVELPTVKVELPLQPKVEVSLPKAEVIPQKIEATLPTVEVNPPSQPETPSTPTSSTPTPTPTPPPASPSSPGGETPRAAGGGTKGTATTASVTTTSNKAPTAAATASTVAAAEPTGRSRVSRRRHRTNPRVVHGGPTRLLAVSYPTAPLSVAGVLPASKAVYRARKTGSSNPLEALGRHIPIPLPVPDWSKPIIALLLMVALWFGARSRLANRRAHRLEGQRDVLLQDVGAMQTALVPVIPRRVGELAVSVAYRPADGPAAGGDFYDVFELDAGKVAVLLGDVAGHGHEALTQAALTRYTLRAYLQAGLEPRAALALTGSVLADAAAAHFATVAVGVYDGSSGTLTYASAGHPPPILAGIDAPEPLTVCCSPPVGWDVPTGRRQTTISLSAGAVVCFFSDGLIEARTADGLLGRERLAGILAELGPRPSSSDLLERVQASAESTPDDMVSCILVPQVSVASVSCHVEELEVDAADLEGDGMERFLGACGATQPEIASALARAREVLAAGEAAVLHVECEPGGRSAAIAILPGLEAPVDAPAHDRPGPALVADVAAADAGRSGHASRAPA
jgi:Stage II sporulation protein E (SpoIIE)